MIYSMVAALNKRGIQATVWHGHSGVEYPQFEYEDRHVHRSMYATMSPGDALVVTEDGGLWWADLAPHVPTTMLVQSHELMLQGYEFDNRPEGPFPGWPQVKATIATSDHIRRVIDGICGPGLLGFDVPVSIDHELFRPREKRRQIAFMPRRRYELFVTMAYMLRRPGVLPGGWELVAIQGMTKESVARILGESAIFVSGAEREGFGMPGAEALAAGALVVGFTGTGGAEYLSDETGVVVHDDDVVGLVEKLSSSTRAFDAGQEWVRERIERGRARVVERYSPARLESAISQTALTLLDPESNAIVTESTLVAHRSTRDRKPRPWWDLYITARKLGGHYRYRRHIPDWEGDA